MSHGLPNPPAGVPADRDLDRLAPKFRAKVDLLLAAMRGHGHDPIVFEAFRSDERATFLHGFGRRYDDGRGVVTQAATAAKSWHRYGLAVDIISEAKQWNASDKFWTDLRKHATDLGLRSGDDWDRDGVPVKDDPDEHMSDRPHVQLGPPMRTTPSDHAWELLQSEGIEAVWREVGGI